MAPPRVADRRSSGRGPCLAPSTCRQQGVEKVFLAPSGRRLGDAWRAHFFWAPPPLAYTASRGRAFFSCSLHATPSRAPGPFFGSLRATPSRAPSGGPFFFFEPSTRRLLGRRAEGPFYAPFKATPSRASSGGAFFLPPFTRRLLGHQVEGAFFWHPPRVAF